MNKTKARELYNKLVCALTHNLDVCQRCKKCGNRLDLIRELADLFQVEVPWEEKNNNF